MIELRAIFHKFYNIIECNEMIINTYLIKQKIDNWIHKIIN